jgi:hypothetical protein
MAPIAVGASAIVVVDLRHRRLPDRPPDDQQQRHDRDLQHYGEPKDGPEPAHPEDRTRYRPSDAEFPLPVA